MAAGDEQDLIEAVVTCEGNLHDPDFQDRFRTLVDNLKTALYISKTKDPFRVRKIEPWNSVRVTISIPKEAAQKLKLLAQQGSNVLRSMGILSVQVEGDQVISLTWASQNNEPTQVILRQTSDEPAGSSGTSGVSSSSLTASSPSLSSISSSVASISSPLPLTPGPSGDATGMAVTLDMLSSSSSSSLSFRSPNVVAPTGEAIPVLPPKGTATGVRPPLGGPFPFVSMTHAAQAIHRSEMSPMMSSNNSVVSNNSNGSNAANSTNSIVSSVPTSTPSLLQGANKPSPQSSVPATAPSLASTTPGAPVFVSTSAILTGVNSEPQVTRLIIENSPGRNSATQLVGSNVASLDVSGTNNVALSHAGPSQSLQLQFVNVPPPYPGVNTVSSNHSLSSSSSHSGILNVQARNQTLTSVAPTPPATTLNSLLPTTLGGESSTSAQSLLSNRTGSECSSEVPAGAAAIFSDSTSGVSSLAQPVSSPLLVNLLQNSDAPAGSSLSTTSSDAYNQQKLQQKSININVAAAVSGKDNVQAKYLLQQHQQMKKTKRGVSLDGASSIPKSTPTGCSSISGPEGKLSVTTTSFKSSTPEQFQFVLPLPSDVASSVTMNRVSVAPSSPSGKVGMPNHSDPSSSNPIKGRTIVQGNIRLLDPASGQMRSIPVQQQQHPPPPPYPGNVATPLLGNATPGETTVAHTQLSTNSEITSLSNGPIPIPTSIFPQSSVVSGVSEGDPKSQNSTIVTFVQSKEQHQVSTGDASATVSTASSSADQSRTLLPITTVNIVSNSSNKSSSNVSSNINRESDSKTFIPPPDPRLSSQVQKLSHSSNSVIAKNSAASNVVVQTAGYNSDAKSSTSQLQHIGRTTLVNKRPPNRAFLPGQITSPGKPRQFLINPLTGHLEPMPSESSSESEEGDDGDGEAGRKFNSHKGSRNKPGKGASLPIAFHRQIVTTETGVTVARVIKSSPSDTNLGLDIDGKKTVNQVPGKGIPFPGNSTDTGVGSVISVSKKLRDDSSLNAALQTLKDAKDPLPGPATVTATSMTGEKIKLRLKLEKNEPISPAYKVDVSFVKKSEKGSFLPGTASATTNPVSMTGSTLPSSSVNSQSNAGEQPRVPPLHISLRGKNAAVVVSPRREEKDMPPPPSTIGQTKEPVVINKESNASENPSTSLAFVNKSTLLNSHDTKLSPSKSTGSTKRVKSRVKSLDGVLDRNSMGNTGDKVKAKLSRPKLSKEVNDRRQGQITSIDESKDSANLTMPVLQPAIMLPTPEAIQKGSEIGRKSSADFPEIMQEVEVLEKVASPINNNVKSPLKEPVADASTTTTSPTEEHGVGLNSKSESDLKEPEREHSPDESTQTNLKSTALLNNKETVSAAVDDTISQNILPDNSIPKSQTELLDSLDTSSANEPTPFSNELKVSSPPPSLDDSSKGAFKIPDSPSVKGGDSTDEHVASPLEKFDTSKPDYPQVEPSNKDESVVSSVISLSTDSCDIISKSSVECEETNVEMDTSTGFESKLIPQQLGVVDTKPETVPYTGATITDTIEEPMSDKVVDCVSLENIREPSNPQLVASKPDIEPEVKATDADVIPVTTTESLPMENIIETNEVKISSIDTPPITSTPLKLDKNTDEAGLPTEHLQTTIASTNDEVTPAVKITELPSVKEPDMTQAVVLNPLIKLSIENTEMSAPQMTVEENIDEQRTREQVEQLKLEQVASDVSDAVLETKEVKSYALDSESDGVNHINDYPKEKPVEDDVSAAVKEDPCAVSQKSKSEKEEIDEVTKTDQTIENITMDLLDVKPKAALPSGSTTDSTEMSIKVNLDMAGQPNLVDVALVQIPKEVEPIVQTQSEKVCPDVKQCSMPNNIEDDKLVQLEMIPSEKGLSTDPSNNKESKSVDAELDIKSEIDPPRLEKLSGLVQEASSAMAEKESNICLKTVEVDGVSTGGKEGTNAESPTVETGKNEDTNQDEISKPTPDVCVPKKELQIVSESEISSPLTVGKSDAVPITAPPSEIVKDESKPIGKPEPQTVVVSKEEKVLIGNTDDKKKDTTQSMSNSFDSKPQATPSATTKVTGNTKTPKERTKLVPQLVSVGSKPTTKVTSVKLKTTTIVEKVETVSDARGDTTRGEGDVNVTIMTPKKTEVPPSTSSAPPISIVLPSESLRSANPDGKGGTKNTYKRRAEIKPGALQNTLKRLHDNLPKVSKTSEKQDALTQSAKVAASANLDTQERQVKESVPATVNSNAVKAAAHKMQTLPQSVSIAIPQARPLPNVLQRPKLGATSSSATATLHQIPGNLQSTIIPNVSIGISSAALTSVASISVASSSSCGQPQTVYAIHPHSIPANFAHLQQSQVVLPGGNKMIPIKLVTLQKKSGEQIQTIPLGAGTPNRASPNLLEAVNIVANAGSRSSSPKTTLIGNTVQHLSTGGNLHFLPISVSSASGTNVTGNVKVLMTQPIKMSQQSGLSQSMVLNSVLMGNQPTTIRVIRPSNLPSSLQEPIAFRQVLKPAADQSAAKKVVKPETPLANAASKPEHSIQSESLFKKLDGVEIVDTGSPLNNDDLPFEADIIHDEKDLADVLAAEAKAESFQSENCTKAADGKGTVARGNHSKIIPETVSSVAAVENHVSSKKLLSISRTDTSTLDSPVSVMRVTSPLYTYSAAPKTRDQVQVSQTPSPVVPDLHGEDEEIINSFSRSPSQPRLSPQVKPDMVSNDMKSADSDVISDHSYGLSSNSAISNCDNANSLGQELSIEIPPMDMEVALSPSQNPPEGKRCTRSTRSNPRLSPDITAFVSETKSNKVSNKVDLMSLRSSPKPSPTGSLKVLSPTPSSLTITPSTSTRSSPILHNQHQINANNAAATINAVAMGIIDKIQGNATAQNAKNSRISKLSGTNKRKRQESDSSSASRDENLEDKAEIDLNSRPGKRKCSENAAEMIKVCIGVEDSPKRNSSTVLKKDEVKSKDGKGKKGMTPLLEEDDDVDSEVSVSRGRSGRSSRESSEDRSSSRGSSAQRIVVTDKSKPAKEKEEESSKETKINRTNSRITKDVSTKAKTQPADKASPHPNATATKKAKEAGSGKATPKRVNRPNSKNKSPLTPAKTRTNVRKDMVATPSAAEKNATSVSTSTATPENENARRKTRSSAAGKRHVT